MAKRRKTKSGNPVTPLLLVLSFLVATLGVYSYIRFRPVGPAEIFLIEPVTLTEGETTLTGTLVKDSPEGELGTYLLILADNNMILLDIQDVDILLGEYVTVAGSLILSTTSEPSSMVVNSITTH